MARGLLLDEDGKLPEWCDPDLDHSPGFTHKAMNTWIEAVQRKLGRIVVPVLLMDEVADLRNRGDHVADRTIEYLRVMSESPTNIVLRLTGTWSETPTFVYNRPSKICLNHQKVVPTRLVNGLPLVETQLMCLYGNTGQ